VEIILKELANISETCHSPDAVSYSLSGNRIRAVQAVAAEGFVGAAVREGAVVDFELFAADMSAIQALVESVLCKRY
jgi:hypothetical protein